MADQLWRAKPLMAVPVCLIGCSGLLGPNMGTKKGVAKAYERQFGHPVDYLDDLCVEWSDTYEGLVLVGYFAMDAGRLSQGVFWGRDFHDNPHNIKALALDQAGWTQRDRGRTPKKNGWFPTTRPR
ncbi:MAG: hypothetical protein HN348_33770 [Proteobacteria bacterium]|jgi:hypothetical protein|nr:hypothetical protein [Pseudomonadota bacterium]